MRATRGRPAPRAAAVDRTMELQAEPRQEEPLRAGDGVLSPVLPRRQSSPVPLAAPVEQLAGGY